MENVRDPRNRRRRGLQPGLIGCFALIALGWLLPGAAHGQTLTISGYASGVFDDPDGGVSTGVGTSFFTWGDPGSFGTGPSSLEFTGNSFTTTVPRNFVFGDPVHLSDAVSLGRLDYFNGTVVVGSTADAVSLDLTVSLTDPAGIAPIGFSNPLELITTLNTPDPIASADIVKITPPGGISPVQFVTPEGIPLTLQDLHFGTVNGGGFDSIDEFFVLEGDSANAELLGRFRPPSEAILRNSVSVFLQGSIIRAVFTPNFGLTISQAATACGYDHFNWYQLVVHDPDPAPGLSVPYFDPQLGGRHDFVPFYWDEPGDLQAHTGTNDLSFFDQPSDLLLKPGDDMEFMTALAGVRADGTWDTLYVFSWSSNYNGASGQVRMGGGQRGGTGGVFNLQLDLTADQLTTSEKLLMAESGSTNVAQGNHAQGTVRWNSGGTTSALFALDGSNPQSGLCRISDPGQAIRFTATTFRTVFVSDSYVYAQGIGSFGMLWACPFTIALDREHHAVHWVVHDIFGAEIYRFDGPYAGDLTG